MASSAPAQELPYGLWESPISVELLSSKNISLEEVVVNPSSGHVYLIESRPTEDGRCCIVEYSTTRAPRDVLPAQYSARSMVQEMGGGALSIDPRGNLIFTDLKTNNVYSLSPTSGDVTLILKAEPLNFFADFSFHPEDDWIIAIREDQTRATPETQATDVDNTLVAINTRTKSYITIAEGDDFYSHPKFNPDGSQVSWIQWSHPDMPWTGSVLYTADWNDGSLQNTQRIAGNALSNSISEPRWGPDGTLFFVDDKTGYWQLYRLDKGTVTPRQILLKGLEETEFASAEWKLGSSTYAPLSATKLAAASIAQATSKIILIDLSNNSFENLDLGLVDLSTPRCGIVRISETSFAIEGSTTKDPAALYSVSIDSSSRAVATLLKSSLALALPRSLYSKPTHHTIPVPSTNPPRSTHYFYYPPQNPQFTAPASTLPPLLVSLHGGPNGASTPALSLSIQFWTTRGYAVCSVNYSGSIGYGREFREALSGYWGVNDVVDIAACVKHLVDEGLVDATRVGVYGGSAGGYATLQSLYMFPTLWAAGVSFYGISDVAALQADSYKFESHDVERMMLTDAAGKPLPKDEQQAILHDRSARFHCLDITAPLLLLQGDIDTAVPPEQTHAMARAMQDAGRTAEVVVFKGEGHGFVKQESIRRATVEQEAWWRKYLIRQ